MSTLTPQQFALRIRSLQPLLSSYARTCLLTYDRIVPAREEVEDAVQEGLRVALESLHTYDDARGTPGLKRWVFTILRRICWKMAQRSKQAREGHIRLVEDQRTRLSLDPAEAATERVTIERALTSTLLTPRERQCLRGTLQGQSDLEIACKLQVKIVTVASARSRAVAKLRRVLKGA